MSTYIYSGPTTGLTLRGAAGEHVEKMLFHGTPVDLPDCEEVRTLVALRRLSPQADTANATPAAVSTSTSTSATATATATEPASAPQPAAEAQADPAAAASAATTTTASTARNKGA